ncbi:MAG: U32 family peptidase [Tissierellia bacterium]|nr:U32 family peptidase [Tissierellia bacterium]
MGIEILAPVGNTEMLYAAIAGGANAVYLAGKSFGARAYASNFDIAEIKEIVNLCHFKDIKVYITVNTIIKEKEIKEAMKFIEKIYLLDIDAVILQDIGLASLVKEFFPKLEVHASTQMSANSLMAVNFLEDLGFTRAILAREVSLSEIEYIRDNSDMELEIFAHGSLCVCYSGKCLMSSFNGGRSGNRGRCAQPCRKKYDIFDFNGNKLMDQKYILSPKDLAIKSDAKILASLGVHSLKIEGRMKKPEYVYAVSNYYSSLFFSDALSSEIVDEVSNRGFTRGFLFDERDDKYIDLESRATRGVEVGIVKNKGFNYIKLIRNIKKRDAIEISLSSKKYTITADRDYLSGEDMNLRDFPDAKIGDKAYRISSSDLRERDYKDLVYQEKRDIIMILIVFVGAKPELEINYGDIKVSVKLDDIVEEGKKLVVDHDYAYKQLSKLGETFFNLKDLILYTDGKSFMSAKMLNEIRRLGTEELYYRIANKYDRNFKHEILLKGDKFYLPENHKSNISISISKLDEKILKNDKINRIYFRDIESISDINLIDFKDKLFFEMPPVATDRDYDYFISKLEENKSKIGGIVLSNWEIELKSRFPEFKIIINQLSNISNSYSINILSNLGADCFQLSPELSIDEIREIRNSSKQELEVFVYGKSVDMITKYSPNNIIEKYKKQNSIGDNYKIRSNDGNEFSIEEYEDYSLIKNSIPISGAEYLTEIQDMGIDNILLRFDRYADNDIIDLFDDILNGKSRKRDIDNILGKTREGHYKKGVL